MRTRLMLRLWPLLAALLLVVWAMPAQAADPQVVTITKLPEQTLHLGDPFVVQAGVPQQAGRWLVNLVLVDTKAGGNADLEGWIPTGTTKVVAAGSTDRTLTWEGHAGATGQFRIYVQAVRLDAPGAIWSTAGSDLQVLSSAAPHTGPLTAVAIGEPVVVVAVVLGFLFRRRARTAA